MRRECFERLVENPTVETEFPEGLSRYLVFGGEKVDVQCKLHRKIWHVIEHHLYQKKVDPCRSISVVLEVWSSSP